MTRARLCKLFIQTQDGVQVFSVVCDFNRRCYRKFQRAGAGRPRFWVAWYELSDYMRRRLMENREEDYLLERLHDLEA